ncbi:MAG: protein kinase domain-containing protein [Anaerolineae bacterium]
MDTRPLTVGMLLKERYRVTRLIAGGGMAWVYEVEEQQPDGRCRALAMKELRTDGDDAQSLEEGRQLFEQEANILVGLDHPNLPRVHAFFDVNGRSYLVMEFVRGESLERRLEQTNAPLLESQVLDWAIQICEVLSYLHTRPQPIIFRDLKPSNVMVQPDGRVKLIDFGIARTYKAGQRRDTMSMGSENYAAPEQWGKAQTDARADVYGLGATMYHLLTNVAPLPAFVPTPRVPIKQYNPAVTDATAAIVDKAMATDRNDRFPSSQAMREALYKCLSKRDRYYVDSRSQARSQAMPQVQQPLRSPTAAAEPPRAPAVTAYPTPTDLAAPSTDKRCGACGVPNRPEARFCRVCGTPFVAPLPPVLTLVRPESGHWEYPLRSEQSLIGRHGGTLPVDLDLDFYDPEGFVSRNHARVTVQQRRYHLEDLESANGTYVNGQRIAPNTPILLRNGDRIRMGRVVLRFQIR